MVQREGRLLRGWLGAAVATSVAALSHLAGGAHIPPVAIWLLAFALSGLVCVGLAGKRLSWPRLLAAVGASQAIYHLLFQLGHAAPGMPRNPTGHAGHYATVPLTPSPVPAPTAEAIFTADPAMLAAHVAAAAATALLLRRGECAAAALAGTLLLAAPRRLCSWTPVPQARLATALPLAVRPVVALGVPLLALRHRGPPLHHAF